MNELVVTGLHIALVGLVILLVPVVHLALTGKNTAERLQAIDAMTALLTGVMVVLAVLQGIGMLVDVALALAAFSFIATVGIARYVGEGKVF